MATVRRNKSGNWEAIIRRKGFPSISRSFPTKREADAFAASMEDKIARGKSVASPDEFTVGQAIEEYAKSIEKPVLDKTNKPVLDKNGLKIMKVDARQAAYLNGLLPSFGEFSIGFLRSRHIAKFVEIMRETPIPPPRSAKKKHPLYDGDKPKLYAESTIRKFVYAVDAH